MQTIAMQPVHRQSELLSVSDVGRTLGVPPRQVSDLFYNRTLPDEWAPIIAGRRMIHAEYVDQIAAALRRAGKLPATEIQS